MQQIKFVDINIWLCGCFALPRLASPSDFNSHYPATNLILQPVLGDATVSKPEDGLVRVFTGQADIDSMMAGDDDTCAHQDGHQMGDFWM